MAAGTLETDEDKELHDLFLDDAEKPGQAAATEDDLGDKVHSPDVSVCLHFTIYYIKLSL